MLIGVGVVAGLRKHRGNSITFLVLIVCAAILAVGTAGTIFASFNGWLIRDVPFFSGYREPQKFVALIVMGYAYFGGLGAATIVRIVRKKFPHAKDFYQFIILLACLLPILYQPLMLWGFDNQLRPVAYPASWYQTKTILDKDRSSYNVLFLPWHLYMKFSFVGRVVANPASQFFTEPVLTSMNPEFKHATGYPQTAAGMRVQQLLSDASHNTAFPKQLSALGIKYVVLDKEFDYRSYDYLDSFSAFKLVLKTTDLNLYEIQSGGERT
jgi:hypothetical protein